MKNSMIVSALFVALVVGGCAAPSDEDLDDDVSSVDEGEGDEEIVESSSEALCLSRGGVVISFGKCKTKKKTTTTTTRPGLPGKPGTSSSSNGKPGTSGASRASGGAGGQDCCYNGSYFKCPSSSACFGGGTPFSPKGPPAGCTPSAPIATIRCGG